MKSTKLDLEGRLADMQSGYDQALREKRILEKSIEDLKNENAEFFKLEDKIKR
jgi:hypothetical protein